ncbi:hypothetical protein [Salinisphaera sp. LB1]|uniref:hypothetical protein n=1 Tax=Salinisphaera sp. LB1 TaxID=2183911 RepID=UPI000D7E0DD8|nr:hypothetical protein [Salinisphaera sp. LB1]AWN15471.1 putative DNA-damage-inducible protein F [Salinisphaera sp. LB1]
MCITGYSLGLGIVLGGVFAAAYPVRPDVFTSDTAFLRTTTLGAALLGFLPLIWLSYVFGWGLLTVFLLARLVATVWRTHSGAWAVGGA